MEKFNFIVNPKTGRKVNIMGVTGKNIIKNFLKELQKKSNKTITKDKK